MITIRQAMLIECLCIEQIYSMNTRIKFITIVMTKRYILFQILNIEVIILLILLLIILLMVLLIVDTKIRKIYSI